MKSRPAELIELSLETVEHIDVDGSRNTVYATFGRQLPIDQFYVGLVLAIARYPDIIALLDVVGRGHVFVDKHLVDVQDGAFARSALY